MGADKKRPPGQKKAKKLKKELLQQESYKKISVAYKNNDDEDFGNDTSGLNDSDDDTKSKTKSRKDNAVFKDDDNSKFSRLLLVNEKIAKSMQQKVDDKKIYESAKLYVSMGMPDKAQELIKKLLNNANNDANNDCNNNKTIDDDGSTEIENNNNGFKKVVEEHDYSSSDDDKMLNYNISTTKDNNNIYDDPIGKLMNSSSEVGRTNGDVENITIHTTNIENIQCDNIDNKPGLLNEGNIYEAVNDINEEAFY
jgi:hypothetical protein